MASTLLRRIALRSRKEFRPYADESHTLLLRPLPHGPHRGALRIATPLPERTSLYECRLSADVVCDNSNCMTSSSISMRAFPSLQGNCRTTYRLDLPIWDVHLPEADEKSKSPSLEGVHDAISFDYNTTTFATPVSPGRSVGRGRCSATRRIRKAFESSARLAHLRPESSRRRTESSPMDTFSPDGYGPGTLLALGTRSSG